MAAETAKSILKRLDESVYFKFYEFDLDTIIRNLDGNVYDNLTRVAFVDLIRFVNRYFKKN